MNDQPISEDYFDQERPMCPRCGVNTQMYSEDVCTECHDEEWLIGTYEGLDDED